MGAMILLNLNRDRFPVNEKPQLKFDQKFIGVEDVQALDGEILIQIFTIWHEKLAVIREKFPPLILPYWMLNKAVFRNFIT